MGHNLLGRLPKTRRWRDVIGLVDRDPAQTALIAWRVMLAADERLAHLKDDPVLSYSFWLLTRLAAAARAPGFAESLDQLGIRVGPETSAAVFVAQVADRVREVATEHPRSGHIAEISSLALRRALADTVGVQGRSLFGSSVSDIQDAVRTVATDARFGDVAQRFFGDVMARTLRGFVDRELANHVGGGYALQTVADSHDFLQALDRHTRESAAIVRDFAGGWFSRHNWLSEGAISPTETQGFVAHALTKLRRELRDQAT